MLLGHNPGGWGRILLMVTIHMLVLMPGISSARSHAWDPSLNSAFQVILQLSFSEDRQAE